MKSIIALIITLFIAIFGGISNVNVASAQDGKLTGEIIRGLEEKAARPVMVTGVVTSIVDSSVVILESNHSWAIFPAELAEFMSADFIAVGDSVSLEIEEGRIYGIVSSLVILQDGRVTLYDSTAVLRVLAASPKGKCGIYRYSYMDFIVYDYGIREDAEIVSGYRGNGPIKWYLNTIFGMALTNKVIQTGKRAIRPVFRDGEVVGLSAWPIPN